MHRPVDNQDVEMALDQAAAWLKATERVAVLTGAGISAESGVLLPRLVEKVNAS
jgi:hypothetical protein